MRLLDAFCGAGGCSVGYRHAGFDEIVGVDIKPMPRYPFEFVQGNAIEYIREHGHEFDVIHASPPCENEELTQLGYLHKNNQNYNHPNLIPQTRAALIEIGKPYIIENVEGAKDYLINPLMLCGTMFGLKTEYGSDLRRHRLFETNPVIWFPPALCKHNREFYAIGVHGGGQHPLRQSKKRSHNRVSTGEFGIDQRMIAMGIDWMVSSELNKAIPPAYTEFIGKRLLELLK